MIPAIKSRTRFMGLYSIKYEHMRYSILGRAPTANAQVVFPLPWQSEKQVSG
jgi:hypothetical protein